MADRISEIKARLEATGSRWFLDHEENLREHTTKGLVGSVCLWIKRDIIFLTHVHDDIRYLLDRVEKLEAKTDGKLDR